MSWPLVLKVAAGCVVIPGPGRYGVLTDGIADDEALRDALLAAARAALGDGAVGWVPAGGGLLSNLPAWENVVLATQWHAPASLAALESRLLAWCAQLGHDRASTARLLAQQPAYLDDDERRLVGWLRQLLLRPRLVLCEREAIPADRAGGALLQLLDDEFAGAALLVVDASLPPACQLLPFAPDEANVP